MPATRLHEAQLFKNTLRMGLTGFCLLAGSTIGSSQSQVAQCTDDAMLVFDGSGSMAATGHNGLDRPRIEDARAAIERSMPRITPFRKVGLIIYGPGPEDSCSNIDLHFRPQSQAAARIIAAVNNLSPVGETPLTEAVRNAADVLDSSQKTGVVVLVTDGRESCRGAPCLLAAQLAAEKNITVHVIGFKVRGQYHQWSGQGLKHAPTKARCLADQTGGKYVSTESTDELIAALQETLSCPMIGSSSQPDKLGSPG